MSSATILTIIAIITLVITAAAAVGGSFRVARNTAVITDYRQAYEGVKAKADGQEAKIAELTASLAEKDSELQGLRGRVAVLQDVVTGKSAIDDLARSLSAVATKMDQRMSEVLSQVGTMRGEVRDAHAAILHAVNGGDHG